jgi:hypothetical protein
VDKDKGAFPSSVQYFKKQRLVESSMILSSYAYGDKESDGQKTWADNTTSRLLLGDDCAGGTNKVARTSCSRSGDDEAPDTEDTLLMDDTSSSHKGESGEDDGTIPRRKTSPASRVATSDKVVTGANPTTTPKAVRKTNIHGKGDNILSRVPWTEEQMKKDGSRPTSERYPSILDEQKERKREKKRERYASMSKEKKDRTMKRARDCGRAKHAAMTEQEKEAYNLKTKEYKRAKHAAMTEQEKEAYNLKKTEYYRATRAAMTEQEKEAYNLKKTEYYRAKRAAMTEQEKEAYNLKKTEYYRAKRAAMTEQEKDADRQYHANYRRKKQKPHG